MATTITLKNIPNELYDRLRASAESNHRSLNSEVLACLEQVLLPTKLTAAERLNRIRRLHALLGDRHFEPAEIEEAIQQGRP